MKENIIYVDLTEKTYDYSSHDLGLSLLTTISKDMGIIANNLMDAVEKMINENIKESKEKRNFIKACMLQVEVLEETMAITESLYKLIYKFTDNALIGDISCSLEEINKTIGNLKVFSSIMSEFLLPGNIISKRVDLWTEILQRESLFLYLIKEKENGR